MKPSGKPQRAEVLPITRTKLTPDMEREIVMLFEATPSYTHVAGIIGIDRGTLAKWVRLGEEGDDRYAALAIGVNRARAAHHEKYMTNLIDVATTAEPRSYNAKVRALEMLLKNQFPKEWGNEIYVRAAIDKKVDGIDLKLMPQSILRELTKVARAVKAANDGADEKEVKRLLDKVKLGKGPSAEDGSRETTSDE